MLPHRDSGAESPGGVLRHAAKRTVRRGEKAAVKGVAKQMGRAARRALGHGASLAARSAARTARRAGVAGVEAVGERARRLPIQRSVDVAVPIEVAWAQWMKFDHLPEGANKLRDVERHGDRLTGRLEGLAETDWEAEIIDERENESFAWRSVEGSDSAGLVTFHQLSDRLTRIELSLDVKPVHLLEAATLALHLADRRAETELRRFKTEAELIDPDSYGELLSGDGSDGDAEEASDAEDEES